MKKRSTLQALSAVALLISSAASSSFAQEVSTEELLAQLANPEAEAPLRIEDRILTRWSRSGSAAMDLLLERGRAALEAGDIPRALEHLTALTDHAPEFAEGWNARASAFFAAEEYLLALDDIARVLTLNPVHFDAFEGLGLTYELLDMAPQAYAAYRATLSLNPHSEIAQAGVERLDLAGQGRPL